MENSNREKNYKKLINRYLDQLKIPSTKKFELEERILQEMLKNHLDITELHSKILEYKKTQMITIEEVPPEKEPSTYKSKTIDRPDHLEKKPGEWTKKPPITEESVPLESSKPNLVEKPEQPQIQAVDHLENQSAPKRQNNEEHATDNNFKEKIRQKAEKIAKWDDSYENLIWLWAESTLELKINRKPDYTDIKDLAELYANREKNLEKIHWYLAENLIKLGK